MTLAVEIAVTMTNQSLKRGIAIFFFVVALIFVYRSFYAMRIPEEDTGTDERLVLPHDVHGSEFHPREHAGKVATK